MASTVQWPTGPVISRKLKALGDISFALAEPLLESYESILVEGNRNRVLRGMQSDDTPMPDVTYRDGATFRPLGRRRNFGTTKYAAKGFGFKRIKSGDPHAHGNLTTAEYRKLTGPPLAPRGEKSRVITNLTTAIGKDGRTFYAVKRWVDVVNKDGVPFLEFHFDGKGRLPRRELRGVGAWEKAEAKKATARWARWVVKQ